MYHFYTKIRLTILCLSVFELSSRWVPLIIQNIWLRPVPHDWPNFYVCVTVGRSDMSKFTEGSWQGSFTVNNQISVRTLKPSSEQKNALR